MKKFHQSQEADLAYRNCCSMKHLRIQTIFPKQFSSLDRLYSKYKSCVILVSEHLNLVFKGELSPRSKKFGETVVKDFSRLYFIAAI